MKFTKLRREVTIAAVTFAVIAFVAYFVVGWLT